MTSAWDFIAGLVFFTGAVVAWDAWNHRTQRVEWGAWAMKRWRELRRLGF